MDDQNQTVTDGGTPPAEATPSAEPDLDTLLKDWSEPGETPKPAEPPPQAVVAKSDVSALLKGMQPLVNYAESSMKKEKADAEKTVTDEAVALIKSDETLKDVDDNFVHDHLVGKYNRDTEFRAAYDNLGENPDGWKKALEGAQSGLAETISALSGNTRSDIEAATAAVNGSSPEPAPEPEISPMQKAAMPEHEWQAHKRERLAQS